MRPRAWSGTSSRCRRSSRAPSRRTTSTARPSRTAQWRISAPKDKGWLAGLQDGGLPYELRGDRDGLPDLGWRSAAGWDDLAERIEDFFVAGGTHGVAEERRLAYVAATRARHALLLTSSVWSRPRTPRVTSRFLDEVLELAPAADAVPSGVRVGPWEALPVPPEDGSAPVKPRHRGRDGVLWPVDHLAHRRVRGRGRRPCRRGRRRAWVTRTKVSPPSRALPTRPRPTRVPVRLEVLLAERSARQERHAEVVELPSHLSTSSLVAFAGDPARFAAELRRPMPSAPAGAARRGTAFHAWVEEHYARAAIVDVFELPGSADEDPMTDEELPAMRERFLASPWGSRQPTEIETPLETVIDGVAIRGRVDAVFRDVDGADWVIVDWKTGSRPTGEVARVRALQLAAYRIAWARLRGVEPERVRGAFYYAGTGETVWPELVDQGELSALLAEVPAR